MEPLSKKKLIGFRFLLWMTALVVLCSLVEVCLRSWPFLPWTDFSVGEVIEVRASWDPHIGMVKPVVRYAANGEDVSSPALRYEVLRLAKAFIVAPSQPDGTVSARGMFNRAPCQEGGAVIGLVLCRKYTWMWLVPEFQPEFIGPAAEAETPLMSASWRGNVKAVEKLLHSGADVNARDNRGRTALWYARTPEIMSILLEAGADIETKDDEGLTPLMLAAYQRDLANIEMLLVAGANLNARSNDGRTALHYAARQRLYRQDPPGTEAVKLLLGAGANPDVQGNAGDTPLMLSANGELEQVSALLTACADANLRNKAGETALSIATREGYAEIVQLLKERTATK